MIWRLLRASSSSSGGGRADSWAARSYSEDHIMLRSSGSSIGSGSLGGGAEILVRRGRGLSASSWGSSGGSGSG